MDSGPQGQRQRWPIIWPTGASRSYPSFHHYVRPRNHHPRWPITGRTSPESPYLRQSIFLGKWQLPPWSKGRLNCVKLPLCAPKTRARQAADR
jgi:hypothetical protein